jgi:GntR family transcriptional regulator, sialic acid-inducible nan operon repressor
MEAAMAVEERGGPTGQRRKRYEEIAEHLELLIFSGRLSVGDKIASERELMLRFGVGRSTVREALFTLQRKGLLSARAGAAARITTPTPQTLVSDLSGAARHLLSQPGGVRHLQHARRLFEVGLAREVALYASDDDLAALSEALEANRRAAEAVDQAAFAHTDLMFHYTLAMIAHNPIYTSFNHAMNQWLAEQRSVSARSGVSRNDVYLEHRAIHDAILRRNASGAQEAMDAHLATVYRNYWAAMAAQPEPATG